MNQNKEKSPTWLLYSLTFHSLILIALLLSLTDTTLFTNKKPAQIIMMDQPSDQKISQTKKDIPQKPEKKESQALDPATFTVPVPVMYYGKELDPNKTPGTPTEKKTDKTQEIDILKQIIEETNSEQLLKEVAESQNNVETLSKNEPSSLENLLTQPTFIPDDTKTASSERRVSKKPSSHTKTSQPKKLTLADIFKKSPMISEETQMIGEGSGQPIIIKEGDMKYYSVWTKFLHHLNQTARFNRIKKHAPVIEWIKTGQLKKDLF